LRFAPPPGRGGAQTIPRPPGAELGRRAPWAGLAVAERRLALERISLALAGRGPGRRRTDSLRPGAAVGQSAVLVALYDDTADTNVVLTRRSPLLRSHRWEVSFPGGRSDAGETPWATALREAAEEVALDPALVTPIGELDQFVTVGSQSLVHPLVASLAARPHLAPAPDEVEHILHVPLSELLADDVFREELWPIGDAVRPITFFELEGDTVWGATAAMLRQLLVVSLGLPDDGFLG
jgi:8-oxo-dGTP pyrophosphatase MutT (NUDIX family)